jgi:hypothetical protein
LKFGEDLKKITNLQMNIFALHPNPRKSARWHLDKHVVKMILETCQLLYTAHWVLSYPELEKNTRMARKLDIPKSMSTAPPTISTGKPFLPVSINHPCAIWTRKSIGNYMWLARLGLELCSEFEFRFGHSHSCIVQIEWLNTHFPKNISKTYRTQFAIAMDDDYKISHDPIRCYRNYYIHGKSHIINYTKRHEPHWLAK